MEKFINVNGEVYLSESFLIEEVVDLIVKFANPEILGQGEWEIHELNTVQELMAKLYEDTRGAVDLRDKFRKAYVSERFIKRTRGGV